MAQIRHLPNAPITEALIDLRIDAVGDISVESLEGELERRRNLGYRKHGPVVRSRFGFSVKPEDTPPAIALAPENQIIGWRLHSEDEKYVALLSLEGMTLSRLPPYQSWETLVAEAKRLWQLYLECVGPRQVTRAATRFINNLRLPFQEGDPFERFLLVPPTVPEQLPQPMFGFLQRFVISDAPSGAVIVFTQALHELHAPQAPVPVILDIDVFRLSQFPGGGNEVWECLSTLRSLKNRFFFGCLTEEAIRLYL
jgi:uncharacterized protein (TIGR04255 family)